MGYHDGTDLTEDITHNGGVSETETFAEYDNNNDDAIDNTKFISSIDLNASNDGFDCELCGTQTTSFIQLEKHYIKHNRKKTSCTICRKKILNIQTHMKKHLPHSNNFEMLEDTETLFECSICRKHFSTLKALQRHLVTHESKVQTNTFDKSVKTLKRTITTGSAFQSTLRIVNTSKDSQKLETVTHNISQGRAPEPVKVTILKPKCIPEIKQKTELAFSALCAICGDSFKSQEMYNRHIEGHKIKNEFKCKDCDKEFHRAEELKIHSRTHSTQLPYSCSICSKQFAQLSTLRAHMHFHKDKTIFECPICHEKFDRAVLLTIHSRKHSNEMLYVCDMCGKAFNTKEHLDEHKLSHSNDQLFNCEICSETFPRKTTLLLHMKSHITELFKCNNCSEKFSKKSLLVILLFWIITFNLKHF